MTWIALTLAALAVALWPMRAPVSLQRWTSRSSPGQGLRRRLFPPRPTRRRSPAEVAVREADFAELVALGLEAGLPVTDALALAGSTSASHGPRSSGDRSSGAPAGPGDEERSPGGASALLGTALHLGADVGAPLAGSARLAAQVLRHRAAAHERTTVLMAGPRASMYLLTALPASGPVVALVLGLSPADVYGTWPAPLLLGVGAVITGGGWWTSRAILARAARPAAVARPRR